MALLSVALTMARNYLNDTGANVWTSTAPDQLLPFAQEAHREMQARLWGHGSPVVRAQSSAITVPLGSTDLGANQPTDILTPFAMVEFGTSETLAVAIPMTEVAFIPQEAQTTTLQYWCWADELIKLLGSSADRKVVVYYRKLIPIPAAGGDPIGVLFGELYLSAAIAAKAHGSLGNKVAYDTLTALAEKNLGIVYNSQRGQQTPEVRP